MDDNDKLLRMAKGLDINSYWLNIPTKPKEYITKRREARRSIFTIRKMLNAGKELTDEKLIALHKIISEQLDPDFGLSYGTFTFAWDISPKSLTKLIRKEQWVKEGGGFDEEFSNHAPTAFTKQKE